MLLVPFLLLAASISRQASSADDSICKKLEVSLTQKIENEGFHRQARWLLERNSTDCRLLLRLEFGKELYINPDEIFELERKEKNLSVFIEGEVDIEVPAYSAKNHAAYIRIPAEGERISLKLPFHLRYQRAQITGGFSKAIFKKPSILSSCPDRCGKNIKVPCDDPSWSSLCQWKNITYEALFDEVELLVPVGDLDDYPLVSIVTLLLGCAGCIYTLSVLSTTPF